MREVNAGTSANGIGEVADIVIAVDGKAGAAGDRAVGDDAVAAVDQRAGADVKAASPGKPVDAGLGRREVERGGVMNAIGGEVVSVLKEIAAHAQIEMPAERSRDFNACAERAELDAHGELRKGANAFGGRSDGIAVRPGCGEGTEGPGSGSGLSPGRNGGQR